VGDGDCTPPLRRCDNTEAADRCVQCLVDADCAAPFVCSTATKTCVECTTANQAACRADLAGARCVMGGSCGCATDADCGGATSGRVCDATTSRCVPGCRMTGGNGCPASLACTSAGAGIGTCQPMPGPDGGTDGGPDGSPTDGSIGDGSTTDGAATDGSMAQDAATDSGDDLSGAAGTGGAGTGGMGGMGGMAGRPDAGPDGTGVNENLGGYVAGGGCQCNTPSPRAPATWLAALAGLTFLVRRRRR
jgi:MYXO-CTERM domain-containing protein